MQNNQEETMGNTMNKQENEITCEQINDITEELKSNIQEIRTRMEAILANADRTEKDKIDFEQYRRSYASALDNLRDLLDDGTYLEMRSWSKIKTDEDYFMDISEELKSLDMCNFYNEDEINNILKKEGKLELNTMYNLLNIDSKVDHTDDCECLTRDDGDLLEIRAFTFKNDDDLTFNKLMDNWYKTNDLMTIHQNEDAIDLFKIVETVKNNLTDEQLTSYGNAYSVNNIDSMTDYFRYYEKVLLCHELGTNLQLLILKVRGCGILGCTIIM